MFSSFKKKLVEIKTDINHKIDRLEVDKNQLLNKTQRVVRPELKLTGVDYLIKRDEILNEIRAGNKENFALFQTVDEAVKNMFLHTSSTYESVRLLEKELDLVLKSMETLQIIIGKTETFCLKLNQDLDDLEAVYERKEHERKQLELERQAKEAREIEEKKLIDELEDESVDTFDLKENTIKLKLTLDS